MIEALRARGWDGDDILAGTLEGDPAASSSKLTPVGVDLDELADALAESAGSEGFVDLHDGQVWTEMAIEASRDAGLLEVEFDDPGRWLTVVGQGPAAPYRTMQRFIATIDDHDTVGRLTDAIDGKGAFRRFYNQLERYPDLLTRWHRFNNDTRLGQARQWLADEGYQPQRGTQLNPSNALARSVPERAIGAGVGSLGTANAVMHLCFGVSVVAISKRGSSTGRRGC